MNLLIDTQAALWFFWNDPALSKTALAAITDSNNMKWFSLASCWEVAIKVGLKKLQLGEPAGIFFAREVPKNSIRFLPISVEHTGLTETLPLVHKDPFDRMLVAQASIESLVIVSSDLIFDSYGIKRIW